MRPQNNFNTIIEQSLPYAGHAGMHHEAAGVAAVEGDILAEEDTLAAAAEEDTLAAEDTASSFAVVVEAVGSCRPFFKMAAMKLYKLSICFEDPRHNE